MHAPDHRNRTSEQIITENILHDAEGFGYRAASWLDLAIRTENFAAFHYACIDGRLAIEHLIFQQLVVTAGSDLTQSNYEKCLSEPMKLQKRLKQIVPDYEKLLDFSKIVVSLSPDAPRINKWKIGDLMKSWGILSSYLHWKGAFSETTENHEWQEQAIQNVRQIIEPLWERMSSGQSGCMVLKDMDPHVREIWEGFRLGKINSDSARIRLEIIRPMIKR
ncbi:MAG: hypothetical protein BMS9Abin18_1082 [Zetaproteobacteria bacterium]|nr:MAG: hypothetical protein BMS9Abin18_1082 [Zetaproteobacteria bacterium]